VFGKSTGGGPAAFFDGNVTITGQLNNPQVNNLQQQLSALQQKEAADMQGIATSLTTLADRVTALGG
jgi:hypothetical protein